MWNELLSFFDIIKYINFKNVIDISLLTLVFYFILKPLRRTKGEIAIQGLIIIAIAMKLSDILGLTGINFFINSIINYGVLAILILFKDEIRKIIEVFGNKISFSSHESLTEIQIKQLKIISDACYSLSKSSTGALIAIERSILLNDYEKNATFLDSLVTEQDRKSVV